MKTLRKLYYSIASKKIGLMLLLLIGIASVLGSAALPGVFYQTLIFRLLLVSLFLNLTLCTINRVLRFRWRLKSEPLRLLTVRQFGSLLLHAAILFILAGGATLSFYGRSGQVQLMPGDTADISRFLQTQAPFALRLNDFQMDFNPDGSVSQYYSKISVLEERRAIKTGTISVNHPLEYRGIKAYQESYGYVIKARFTNSSSQEIEKICYEGDVLQLPGTQRTVKLVRYIPNYDSNLGMNSRTTRPDNPRVIFSVYENSDFLGFGAAAFGEKLEIDSQVPVVFSGVQPYTILKIKSDPGLPLALAGGVMLMLGVCLSLLGVPVQSAQSKKVPDEAGITQNTQGV